MIVKTRVRDNILKSKEQKNIQPTKGDHKLITIKDLQVKFGISPTTAKNDIIGLLKKNIITEIALNKVKRAYIRGEGLDSLLSQ
mgnify:CR=1 FL=1